MKIESVFRQQPDGKYICWTQKIEDDKVYLLKEDGEWAEPCPLGVIFLPPKYGHPCTVEVLNA